MPRLAGERADLEFVALDRDDIEVVQINRVAGVGDDRAHIAGEKIFVLAHAEHERAAAPRADDEIRNVAMNQRDAVGADDLLQRGAHGVDQKRLVPCADRSRRRRVVVNVADQMREDFGVGFGSEMCGRLRGSAASLSAW